MSYLSLSSKEEFKKQLRSLIFCYRRSSHVSSSSSVTFCAYRALQSWRTKRAMREHSCVSSRTPPNRGLTRRPHLLTSTPCMSPSSSTGEDPQGDCISPFIAKSRNKSTPLSISQRISSCALPKTEPAGDALQSTALRSANDGDDDDMMIMMMINFLMITIHPGNIYALKRRFIYFSPLYLF